jgi:HlyD family secretion protein
MRKHPWIVAAGALVIITLTALVFRPKPVLDIATAEVTSGTVTRRIFATGTLQATRTVDIGTQVSGVVASLGVDFNSFVHKGNVIARLDPSLFQAALAQARAALTQTQALLNQAIADRDTARSAEADAKVKLTRAAALSKDKLITQADLDAAQIALDEASAGVRSAEGQIEEASAGVAQAQANVGQASINLEHTVITSPIDGIVLNRSVDVGQTVAAAVQAPVLFTLATDLSRLQLQVNVDQSEVGGIQVGQPVTFEVESFPDEVFHGVVSQLRLQPISEPSAANVVSYATMIDVDNPGERLRPGMTASLVLSGLQHANVTRVPNVALSFRPSADVLRALGESELQQTGHELWTYDGKKLTPHPAQYALSDLQWTELAKGDLRPGDRVVTSASFKVLLLDR